MRLTTAFGVGLMLAVASLQLAGPASAAAPRDQTSATPRSASGCTTNSDDSKTSCIDVEGSKLVVDRVVATENYGGFGSHCATPRLFANGSLFATGPQRCSTFSVQWTFPLNQEFDNHTQLCTAWSDATNLRPCETVHD